MKKILFMSIGLVLIYSCSEKNIKTEKNKIKDIQSSVKSFSISAKNFKLTSKSGNDVSLNEMTTISMPPNSENLIYYNSDDIFEISDIKID